MPSGSSIANLSIATSESWRDKTSGERKEKTEWHRVVVFSEGLVRIVEQYLKKGAKVYIEGQLETRKWQDKDGNDKYSTEVVLRNFNSTLTMLDGKSEGAGCARRRRVRPGPRPGPGRRRQGQGRQGRRGRLLARARVRRRDSVLGRFAPGVGNREWRVALPRLCRRVQIRRVHWGEARNAPSRHVHERGAFPPDRVRGFMRPAFFANLPLPSSSGIPGSPQGCPGGIPVGCFGGPLSHFLCPSNWDPRDAALRALPRMTC